MIRSLHRKSFTIIETIIAIFILEIGVLGIGSFFTYSFRITKEARNETIAANLASGLLDDQLSNAFDNLTVGTTTRSRYSDDPASPFYSWEKQTEISYIDAALQIVAGPTAMKKIAVTVFWNDNGEKNFTISTIKSQH